MTTDIFFLLIKDFIGSEPEIRHLSYYLEARGAYVQDSLIQYNANKVFMIVRPFMFTNFQKEQCLVVMVLVSMIAVFLKI